MSQLLHLDHPEDKILTGDLSVLDWFVSPGTLSLKIDGSPSIVWGTDPRTGTFFVGTKAVFNKKKIRIAHSHEEIDQYYEGEVATILHSCFDHLPRTDLIYQGDFIGFGGSDTYAPNAITYKFPEVIDHQIIIAPHTTYAVTNDLRDSVAYSLDCNLEENDSVKWVKPDAYIAHNQESFADVKEVCLFALQMASMVTFVDDKKATELKKQINTCIRTGKTIEPEDFDCDSNLIGLWKLVKSIKEDCLFLCRNNGPEAYIRTDRIDAEGYVLTNSFGSYKLVNREVFSYHNFNLCKFSRSTSKTGTPGRHIPRKTS